MENMNEIKVEIRLGDLAELKEYAGYYRSAAKDRDAYLEELIPLRKEVAKLRELVKKNNIAAE